MIQPSRAANWPTWVIGAFFASCAVLLAWSLISPKLAETGSLPSPLPVGTARSDDPAGITHIVIFLIDTLRADRLGTYGYDKLTSPNIDELARESVVFDNAYTPAPWTLPSVASLMTSTFPCEHGVLVDGQRIAGSLDPLAARLQRIGYTAASFHANPYAGPMSGLDRGFGKCELVSHVDGQLVRDWLDTAQKGPHFLYLHSIEPHDPYLASEDSTQIFGTIDSAVRQTIAERCEHYRKSTRVDLDAGLPIGTTNNTDVQRSALRALDEVRESYNVLYDAAVRDADARVGEVIEELKRRDFWNDTLFILMSDHGEELSDHGGWQHDQSVYEELVRIPLIIKFPRGEVPHRRVQKVVSLVDVMPTVLEFIGHSKGATSCRGESLMSLVKAVEGLPADDPTVPAMRHNIKKFFRPYKEQRGDLNVVVRLGDWKAIWNVEPDTMELYDLSIDRAERENFATERAEFTTALKEFAKDWLSRCREQGAGQEPAAEPMLDEAQRARLRSLGYVE